MQAVQGVQRKELKGTEGLIKVQVKRMRRNKTGREKTRGAEDKDRDIKKMRKHNFQIPRRSSSGQ